MYVVIATAPAGKTETSLNRKRDAWGLVGSETQRVIDEAMAKWPDECEISTEYSLGSTRLTIRRPGKAKRKKTDRYRWDVVQRRT